MWAEIISAAIEAGGQIGGQAVKNQGTGILADAQNTLGYIQGATAGTVANWQTLQGGYASSGVLAQQLGLKYQQQAAITKAKLEAETQKRNTILLVGLGAAALLIVAIVILNR